MNRVANTYARAAYQAAVEANIQGQDLLNVENNLVRVGDAVQMSRELRSILKNPSVTNPEKTEILKKLLNDDSSRKFVEQIINLIIGKGRIGLLSSLGDAFTEIRMEAQGAVLGLVESADPLKDSDLQDLSASFEKKLGKKVFFKTRLDPNLLAGVKVTVNGITYDGTVRAQLNQLRDQMAGA